MWLLWTIVAGSGGGLPAVDWWLKRRRAAAKTRSLALGSSGRSRTDLLLDDAPGFGTCRALACLTGDGALAVIAGLVPPKRTGRVSCSPRWPPRRGSRECRW